jgi:hypothetical protein
MAEADKIPLGLEKHVSYNRPSCIPIDVDISGSYAAGDILGGILTVFDERIARNYDGMNVRTISVLNADNFKPELDIYILDRLPETEFEDGDNLLSGAIIDDVAAIRNKISITTSDWETEFPGIPYTLPQDVQGDLDTRNGNNGPFYLIVIPKSTYVPVNGFVLYVTMWVA